MARGGLDVVGMKFSSEELIGKLLNGVWICRLEGGEKDSDWTYLWSCL